MNLADSTITWLLAGLAIAKVATPKTSYKETTAYGEATFHPLISTLGNAVPNALLR